MERIQLTTNIFGKCVDDFICIIGLNSWLYQVISFIV